MVVRCPPTVIRCPSVVIRCPPMVLDHFYRVMLLKCACYTQLQHLSHDHAVAEETHACGAS